jgi:hypothetical protein
MTTAVLGDEHRRVQVRQDWLKVTATILHNEGQDGKQESNKVNPLENLKRIMLSLKLL